MAKRGLEECQRTKDGFYEGSQAGMGGGCMGEGGEVVNLGKGNDRENLDIKSHHI